MYCNALPVEGMSGELLTVMKGRVSASTNTAADVPSDMAHCAVLWTHTRMLVSIGPWNAAAECPYTFMFLRCLKHQLDIIVSHC